MATIPVQPCPGCEGTRRCWICLGTGKIECRDSSYKTCESCSGSGKCTRCEGAADSSPEQPVLPTPRPQAFSPHPHR